MSWDYRVVQREHSGIVCHEIIEVYYDGNGVIESWTGDSIAPFSNSGVGDLKKELRHMLKAFEKPVLIEGNDGLVESQQ